MKTTELKHAEFYRLGGVKLLAADEVAGVLPIACECHGPDFDAAGFLKFWRERLELGQGMIVIRETESGPHDGEVAEAFAITLHTEDDTPTARTQFWALRIPSDASGTILGELQAKLREMQVRRFYLGEETAHGEQMQRLGFRLTDNDYVKEL